MDKKNKITNRSARADEELVHECDCKHDPLFYNEGLRSELRVCHAIDVLSRVINGCDLDYVELNLVIGRLMRYYENVAEINGIKVEDLKCLPPIMLDESDFE